MSQINDLLPELNNSAPFIMGLTCKQFRTRSNQLCMTEIDLTLEMPDVLRTLGYLGEVPSSHCLQPCIGNIQLLND